MKECLYNATVAKPSDGLLVFVLRQNLIDNARTQQGNNARTTEVEEGAATVPALRVVSFLRRTRRLRHRDPVLPRRANQQATTETIEYHAAIENSLARMQVRKLRDRLRKARQPGC